MTATMRTISQPTPAAIMQIGTGFMGSKTLLSAVELGVFSTLADGPADRRGERDESGRAR